MKICITSRGSDADSLVDPHFGRAQNFIFLNEKGEIEEVLKNPGIESMRGAGISAAQVIADKKVDVVITGNVGPSAFRVLSPSGIKIFLVDVNLTVKEVFSLWEKGELEEINLPSVQDHFGQGPHRGSQGRGFGRRR